MRVLVVLVAVGSLALPSSWAAAETGTLTLRGRADGSFEVVDRDGERSVVSPREIIATMPKGFRAEEAEAADAAEAEAVDEEVAEKPAGRAAAWELRNRGYSSYLELRTMDAQTRRTTLRNRRSEREEAAAEYRRLNPEPIHTNYYDPVSWYAKPKKPDQPTRTYYKRGREFVDAKTGRRVREKDVAGSNVRLVISEQAYRRSQRNR
jgi:hypothetical protein